MSSRGPIVQSTPPTTSAAAVIDAAPTPCLNQRGWNLAASLLVSLGIAAYLTIAGDSAITRDLFSSVTSLGSEAHREPSHVTQAAGEVRGGVEAMLSLEERLRKASSVIRRDMKHIEGDHGEANWAQLYKSVHNSNERRVIDKLKVTVLTGAPFIIGVQGTSVTAGHDNYFNQSYPVVLESLAQGAFHAAGINMTVRNNAMGWNPIFPSHFCVAEVQGEDVDVATWEFGMMMNGEPHYFEFFLRNALFLPKQPIVMILDPGEPARDEDRSNPPMTFDNYARDLVDKYKALGVIMQGMYEAIWTLEFKEQRYSRDFLYAADKPTERPAGWHPGPHGHHLRAQILAYFFLDMLHTAIQEVVDVLSGPAANRQDSKALVQALMDKDYSLPLPKPSFCRPDICEHPAHCLTTFEPRAGPSLLEHVIHPPPDQIPNLDWRVEPDRTQSRDNTVGKWHTQLYSVDVDAVAYSILEKKFNYLDRKYVLQGKGTECGPLKIALTTTQHAPIILCSPPGNQIFQTRSAIYVDDAVVRLLPDLDVKQYFDSNPCYITETPVPPGKHVVTYQPDDKVDDSFPISHVVWF